LRILNKEIFCREMIRRKYIRRNKRNNPATGEHVAQLVSPGTSTLPLPCGAAFLVELAHMAE
jgi:hypothetical protein